MEGKCRAQTIWARWRLCPRFADRSPSFSTGVDLVLTPTAAALPWPAETPYPDRIDGKPAGPRDHAIFTGWVNLAGVPALNIPIGMSRSRLPIGAHLVAAFGADEQLLAFAREVSDAVPPQPLPQLEAAV